MKDSREKVEAFLADLDELSRKHGVWIETHEGERDSVTLVDEDTNMIAYGLYNDEDTQEYLVDKGLMDEDWKDGKLVQD